MVGHLIGLGRHGKADVMLKAGTEPDWRAVGIDGPQVGRGNLFRLLRSKRHQFDLSLRHIVVKSIDLQIIECSPGDQCRYKDHNTNNLAAHAVMLLPAVVTAVQRVLSRLDRKSVV